MNDIPRKKLIELVDKHGPSLCNDPGRLEGLLRDFCSGYQKEIFILVAALKQHVCEDLITQPASVSTENRIRGLIVRLCENLGLSDDAARWAVVSWAIALNVISPVNQLPFLEKHTGGRGNVHERRQKRGRKKKERPYLSVIVSPDGEGQFTTIQSAIHGAPIGARIFVRPGIYRENLIIEKPLEIIGEGRPTEVILESKDQPCIVVRAGRSVVHGLTIRQVIDTTSHSSPAIVIQKGDSTLEDSIISPAQIGIVLQGGTKTTPSIRRCRISGAAETGISVNPKCGGFIEDCILIGNTRGIQNVGSSGVFIRHCAISRGHIGVEIGNKGMLTIEDCEIAENTYAGIAIHEAGNPVIRRCTISKGQFGVEITDRGKGILENVQISNNAQGVLISRLGDPSIQRCILHHNQFGIRVTLNGKGLIEDTDILENEFAGISIKEGGNPSIRRCKITKNGDVGIWIHKSGLGTLERNDVSGNKKGAFYIEAGSQVKRRANQE